MKALTLSILCLLLAGCPWGNRSVYPGPTVINATATDVGFEVRLTDGTVRSGTYKPCYGYRFFRTQPPGYRRTVFVERLTFRKDGAVLGVYEGANVEALGATAAMFDETGLRQWNLRHCSRVFNTSGQVLRVIGHYEDGDTASVTLRPCEPLLWTSDDLARPRQTDDTKPGPVSLVVTRGDAVIHQLNAREIRKTFKLHLRRSRVVYAIGTSAIKCTQGFAPPAPCALGAGA